MGSIQGYSAACCNIPPIISDKYQQKGRFESICGLATYVTGPSNATKALILTYDVFGFFPQTLQGADILSTSDKEHEYLVFIPDFFEGQPADISWYPADTEAKKYALAKWFPSRTPYKLGTPQIPHIISSIEEIYGKKTWGAVGFCWGAKVTSLLSGPNSPFKASVQAHPAMMDVADAARISIPVCMLASRHEDGERVRAWEGALKTASHVEVFGDQEHGWMSARGDLGDERVRAEYERGYRVSLEFLGRYL